LGILALFHTSSLELLGMDGLCLSADVDIQINPKKDAITMG
jgi:hypothetical protein